MDLMLYRSGHHNTWVIDSDLNIEMFPIHVPTSIRRVELSRIKHDFLKNK